MESLIVTRIDPRPLEPRSPGITSVAKRLRKKLSLSRKSVTRSLRHPAHEFEFQFEADFLSSEGVRVLGHDLSEYAVYTIWSQGHLIYHLVVVLPHGATWESGAIAAFDRWCTTGPNRPRSPMSGFDHDGLKSGRM